MTVKVNDRIEIKGADATYGNHEGRVTQVVEGGVYIANMNMPFMGTYARFFVPTDKIIEVK